jgi:hypothetical protein
LFSRSRAFDRMLERGPASTAPEAGPADQFDRISNDFWFKAMLAVSKVARNDLLVALHLSLDLVRDCCLLGMMLRDRQSGTTHHRDGSGTQPFMDELTTASRTYTTHGILSSVEHSGIVFDSLASQWREGHEDRRGPLVHLIQRVRHSLPEKTSEGRRDAPPSSPGT